MAEQFSSKPVHQQIADLLRQEIIANYKSGHRLPSGGKLGKRFGVSHTTIHNALAELIREGFIESRHGSGTFVTGRTDKRHIAVYMEKDIADPRCSYFYRRCMQQLRHFFERRDMPVRLYVGSAPFGPRCEEPDEPTCREFLEAVKNNQIKAVAAVNARPHPSWINPLKERGVPVVGDMNHQYGIHLDYRNIIHEAVAYLLNQGRQRVALLAANDPDDPPQRYRYLPKYFEQEMEQRGLKSNPSWIRWDLHPVSPTAGWCEFREIWTTGRIKPDGLIITDDFLYQSASQAIMELGINVPEQLKIISLCNKGSGMFQPVPVSLIQIDPDEAASKMGQMLLKRMNGEPIKPGCELLSFEWVDSAAHANNKLEPAGAGV